MPMRRMRAYVEMLPILRASETLDHAQAVYLGSPAQSNRAAQEKRREMGELQRVINRRERNRPQEITTPEQMMAAFTGAGITVERHD